MTLLDWFAVAYWPLAAGIVLLYSLMWRGAQGHKQRTLVFSLAAFATLISLLVVFVGLLANQSKIALIDGYIFFVVLGGLFFVAIRFAARTTKADPRILASAAAIFAIIFTGIGLWNLVGDFAISRITLEGLVTDTYASTSRSGRSYHVLIDGRHHPTTADIFAAMKKGERIRAEVGAGSGNIFAFQPME
jgi:hypothetical protein